VLGRIVQTFFGRRVAPRQQQGFSELAVRYGQALFISHLPVTGQCFLKLRDSGLGMAGGRGVQRQIVVENTKGAMVVQGFKKIQRFEVVLTRLH